MKSNNPIGIFDSGVGGLTVAKAIIDILPNESIIYFGDTAHLPYGDKSSSVIQGYVKNIADFLLSRDVKLILIACNSASAAYEMLVSYVGSQALVVNVVSPVVKFLSKNYSGKCIGLIGTKLTIDSRIYHNLLSKLSTQIDLRVLATPLLVPMIEGNFFPHKLMNIVLSEYLSDPILRDIKALVLGCTHYPIIKNEIANFYQNRIDIIDASEIVASSVKSLLDTKKMLATSLSSNHFYVSNYTASFVHRAKSFFGEGISVEAVDIF